MSLATLGGAPVTSCLVQIPRWGCPWVSADLSGAVALTGRQTLQIADVSVACTVVSGGTFEGRSAYRLAVGAGGWGKEIDAKSYSDDAGVKVSTLLRDAALSAGETIEGLPTTRTGPHFARRADMASSVLNLLAARAWRVGLDGVTRLGEYPPTTYTGNDTRTRVSPGSQVVEIAATSLAALVPGVSVDGSLPASDIEWELTESKLVARAFFSRRSTRRRDALTRLVASLFPALRYAGAFEYRVVSQTGNRLNLQAVRASTGLPDLPRVPVRPGVPGVKSLVKLGELVLVVFADNDPSRPQVIAHDHADSPGWMPLSLELGGPGALPIAYQGSTVQAGPFAGAVTLGSTLGAIRP